MKRLTLDQIKHITDNKPALTAAATAASIPWQLLAAIWYRESFSVTSPHTPGGPFQFDPVPTVDHIKASLKHFTNLAGGVIDAVAQTGVNDFKAAAYIAAAHLRNNSHFPLAVDHSDEAIKDAMYGYNGRVFGPHPESSNYVYNEFDLQHVGMMIHGTIPDPKPGNPHNRKRIDVPDQRPGAFVVYRQLVDMGA